MVDWTGLIAFIARMVLFGLNVLLSTLCTLLETTDQVLMRQTLKNVKHLKNVADLNLKKKRESSNLKI